MNLRRLPGGMGPKRSSLLGFMSSSASSPSSGWFDEVVTVGGWWASGARPGSRSGGDIAGPVLVLAVVAAGG